MFRHVVLMTWIPEATPAQVESVLSGLGDLAHEVPTLRAFSFGADAALAVDNADLAVVADFDDEDGYRDYAAHPAHVALVTARIKPILAGRVAVQYHMDEGSGAADARTTG